MTTPISCPTDGSPLLPAPAGDYPSHHCTGCDGAWIAGTLLRDVRAFAVLQMHRRRSEAPDGRSCPADGTSMRQMVYKGIPMEVCPQCFGLWMGNGVLARLVEMVGPPVGADLSKIGRSLATVTGEPAVSRSSDAAELMRLSMDVIDGLGKLVD